MPAVWRDTRIFLNERGGERQRCLLTDEDELRALRDASLIGIATLFCHATLIWQIVLRPLALTCNTHGCKMAKFDPFLSLDCARVEGVGAQSKERKGSNFAA